MRRGKTIRSEKDSSFAEKSRRIIQWLQRCGQFAHIIRNPIQKREARGNLCLNGFDIFLLLCRIRYTLGWKHQGRPGVFQVYAGNIGFGVAKAVCNVSSLRLSLRRYRCRSCCWHCVCASLDRLHPHILCIRPYNSILLQDHYRRCAVCVQRICRKPLHILRFGGAFGSPSSLYRCSPASLFRSFVQQTNTTHPVLRFWDYFGCSTLFFLIQLYTFALLKPNILPTPLPLAPA